VQLDDVRERVLRAPLRPQRTWWIAVLVAGAALSAWRAWQRLSDPSLWGEDGYVFLKGAREDGPASILHRYAGFLHVVPRLVALVLRPLPLTWQPGLYAAAAVGIGLAGYAVALSPRLDWLLPARWQRALLFGALVVAPARNEVTANIANLIFTGGVALLLLGLCRDPATGRGRWTELVAAGLLALGGILAVMLVPVYAARAVRVRSRHSTVLAVLVTGCGVLQVGTLLTDPRTGTRAGSPGVVVSFLHHRLLPAWLLGDDGWAEAWRTHPVLLASACVALGAVLVGAVAALRWTGLALLASLLLAATAAGLTYRRLWYLTIGQRHLVLPLAVLAVLLVAALGARPALLRAGAALALAAALIGVHTDWYPQLRPDAPVGPTAACLAEHRAPCLLPVNVAPPVYLDR
jgi:hypothetical protein